MDRARRAAIEDLFEAALERTPQEREGWLREAAGEDGNLLAEVSALLAAHERAEAAFAEAERSSAIGPYRLIREIGRGGMGVVYLAERADGQYRRRVAIKVLRHTSDADPLHQRFLAERQILAGLEHTHIAGMLDGGVTGDGRPYVVMEHVDGLPITTFCDERRLDVEARLRLFMDVCSAVQHAHRSLVIHRDLKPANILVTSAGEVKLLDFGIAKIMDQALYPVDLPVTRMDVRVMTPEYASPEQVRGDSLTTASDVYALGVLLYELLTGCRPYELGGGSLVDVVCETNPARPSVKATEARTAGTPSSGSGGPPAQTPVERAAARSSSPERLRRALSGDLDSIVLMALRKEPEARYASAELMRHDIERHLSSLPVLAHRGTRRYRLGRFLRRHRLESAAAVLVALSMIGGTALASREAAIAAREQERAETERARAQEVSRFLEGLFASIDPYAPTPERLDTLPARALLERGAARVRSELSGQPLVQANMLDVIGRVYRSLGLYDDARGHLEESLRLRRASGEPSSAELATSLGELGALLVDVGSLEPGLAALEEALDVRRRLYGEGDHPEIAGTLNALGRAFRELGRYDAAEVHHLEAMAMLRRTSGDDAPELATFTTDLVKTLEWAGDRAGEERWARESVELHRRLFGPGHPALAIALRDLGLLLQRNGAYTEASELFDEAYEIAVPALGEVHPQVADLLNRIASIRYWLGDLEAADSIHQVSIALKRKVYGDAHLEITYGLNNLASVRRELGRFESADSLHREALEMVRGLVGEEHAAYWTAYANRANTFTEARDCAASVPMHRAAIEGLRRTIPSALDRRAVQLTWLGECLVHVGEYEEAERVLVEAYQTLLPRGESDNFVMAAAENLRTLYERLEAPEAVLRGQN
jgi:eukaryotic-like serine/threonine-protein kinase